VEAGGTAVIGVDDSYGRIAAERIARAGKSVVRISVTGPLRDGIYAEGSRIVQAIGGKAQPIAQLAGIASLRGALPGIAIRLNGAVPAMAYLVMVVLFFLYFYPLWTGLPLTSDALNSHVWFVFKKPLPNWCLCYWTSPG